MSEPQLIDEALEVRIPERKRAAPFRTIYAAAAELALEVGLENATVDTNSNRADL